MLTRLPAAADLFEPQGNAGQEESESPHQHRQGEEQHQHEGGRQQELVLIRFEGSIPAKKQGVEGGHEEGTVTQR